MTNRHDPSAAAAARTDADYVAALERWFLTKLRERTDARTAERIFRAEWAQILVHSAYNLRTITADERRSWTEWQAAWLAALRPEED